MESASQVELCAQAQIAGLIEWEEAIEVAERGGASGEQGYIGAIPRAV